MHRVTWSDIEPGKNANPTPRTLEKVSMALGCTLADLFIDEGNKSVTLK